MAVKEPRPQIDEHARRQVELDHCARVFSDHAALARGYATDPTVELTPMKASNYPYVTPAKPIDLDRYRLDMAEAMKPVPNKWRRLLTAAQMDRGAQVGLGRLERAQARGAQHRATWGNPDPDKALAYAIGSARGELAVSLMTGLPWADGLDRTIGDVGGHEVRWTSYQTGRLRVHDDDKPGSVFILARGPGALITADGWFYGHEAQQSRFWKALDGRRPAYFVDQHLLHPMNDLPPAPRP